MTVQELYEKMGGSYEDAKRVMMADPIIGRMVMMFKADPNYQKLMDAYAQKDEKAMFDAAHALKGVCGNLGMTELFQSVEIVTNIVRPANAAHRAEADLDSEMEKLTAAYEKVMAALGEFEQG